MAFQLKHSQNYLHNQNLVKYLIKQTTITNQDSLIEIGPGKGIITEALASCCLEVQAIEKDTNLANQLKQKLNNRLNIQIVSGDFLDYSLPNGEYKIFSNIPFTITADIVKKILNAANPPSDCYLIIQQEAANKFSGQPYGSETLMSILYKPWFLFETLHVFKPTDFIPVPKVTAVLLRIEKRLDPLITIENAKQYKDFIAYGFTQAPGLKKSFEAVFGNIEFNRLANDFSFSAEAKATDITFDQWLGIFQYFIGNVSQERKSKIRGAYKRIPAMQKNLTKIHRTRN